MSAVGGGTGTGAGRGPGTGVAGGPGTGVAGGPGAGMPGASAAGVPVGATSAGAPGDVVPAPRAVPGPLARWVAGARPRTLPAALVPVLVGTAAAHASGGGLARGTGGFWESPWWKAAGALVVALALQVATNYANDYSDGIRGTDDDRVGPLRLVASGLASPASVKRAAMAAFAVAGVVGLALAWATSWWVLLVGAACLAAGWFYTGGPRPYGYAGFGEVFVFVFFGLVATGGTYYVQTLHLGGAPVLAASIAVGLLATALLLANNLRDIATDREAGKRTLAARVGRRAGGLVYVACVLVPFAVVAVWGVLAVTGAVHPAHLGGGPALGRGREALLFLPLLALPLALRPVASVLGDAHGRALLPVLADTGRLQLAFGALLAVGLWVGW